MIIERLSIFVKENLTLPQSKLTVRCLKEIFQLLWSGRMFMIDCLMYLSFITLSSEFPQIQNNQHGGSKLRFAPFAKLDDGYLDLIIVH